MSEKPRSFRAFWPHYLMAHQDPRCRRLHYVGSTGALIGIVFAYAMAWTGHFAVERNRPATFGNPLWSLIGDIRMYLLWLSGRLESQLGDAERIVAQTGLTTGHRTIR